MKTIHWTRNLGKADHRHRIVGQRIRKLPGFTLIELLVVIGIIAILASLVLSSLGRAKAQAGKVECLSDLRQWAIALQMYTAEDSQHHLPREGQPNPVPGRVILELWDDIKNPDNNGNWYNVVPDYLPKNAARYHASEYSGQREVFYSKQSMFQCPAAQFVDQPERGPEVYFSRPMNSQLINPGFETVNFWNLPQPELTVIFLDARVSAEERKVCAKQTDIYLGQPAAFATRFAPRHSNGGNLAFADGHVKWFPGDQVVETQPDHLYQGKSIWPVKEIMWAPTLLQNPNVKGLSD